MSRNDDIIERIRAIALPIIEDMGLTLWGMRASLGHKGGLVRLYVDAPGGGVAPAETDAAETDAAETGDAPAEPDEPKGEDAGVTIDQLGRISRQLGYALEAEGVDDMIPGAYTLEVSSPGLERPFFSPEQMAPYTGRQVEVRLTEPLAAPFPGRKRLIGVLDAVENKTLFMTVDAEALDVAWADVDRANLVHAFPTPQKPGKGKKGAN